VVKVQTDTFTTDNICSQTNRDETNSRVINGECVTATSIDGCNSSDESNSSTSASVLSSVLSTPVAPRFSLALTASDTAVSPTDEIFDQLFYQLPLSAFKFVADNIDFYI